MTLSRRQMPSLSQLQAFESAARHGSFTGAARELNLTQSAVSRQIGELEGQLSVQLFERVKQRTVLSDAGRRFLPDVRKLLRQAEDSVMRAMSAPTGTTLNLAVLPTFGTRWLVPRLPDLLRQSPELWIRLGSHIKPFDLRDSAFDAAIHYGQPTWAGAVCRYICREEIFPVASAAFLAAAAPRTGMDVVGGGPFLHLETRPSAWRDWFDLAPEEALPVFRGHRFDQFGMIVQAALSGMGLALLPRYLIEEELASGALEIVAERSLVTDNCYYLAVAHGAPNNPLVERFYEWICAAVSR